MALRSYTLTLTGHNELLMDRDNITYSEEVTRWQKDPLNKDQQRPGDDRTPAWIWLGKIHYADTEAGRPVGIPVGMLAACARDAATMIAHPTAKGKKTLRDVSQSGILFGGTCFPLHIHRPGSTAWDTISYDELHTKLRGELDFQVHQAVATALGCPLDVRRAKPQGLGGRHVRVRPKFGPWRVMCHITVTDDVLTEEVVLQMFRMAGHYKGLGNWRPSTYRSGAYGTFSVEMT